MSYKTANELPEQFKNVGSTMIYTGLLLEEQT
jgi:hypothetical protein